MNPVIEFEGYSIKKLVYGILDNNDENEEFNESKLRRKVSIGVSEDQKKAILILNVLFVDKDNQKSIDLEVIGEFVINVDLDIKKIEELLSVNGVALVYPYARSIISMVTSLDSSSAVVIPTINTKIFQD